MLKYINTFDYPSVFDEDTQFVDQPGITVDHIHIGPINNMIQAEIGYRQELFLISVWREGISAMLDIGEFASANILKNVEGYTIVEIYEPCDGKYVLVAVYHKNHGWISVGASRAQIVLKHHISID
jgi:hypothetical protein